MNYPSVMYSYRLMMRITLTHGSILTLFRFAFFSLTAENEREKHGGQVEEVGEEEEEEEEEEGDDRADDVATTPFNIPRTFFRLPPSD